MNLSQPSSYILITGHRKSGTTLLHKLFDGHPELNTYPVDISLLYGFLASRSKYTNEQDIKNRINHVIKKSTISLREKILLGIGREFNSEEFCECFWESTSPGNLTDAFSIIEAISSSWCRYSQSDPKKPFLLKETSQSIFAYRLIANSIPLKIIQIIRDPRDNYAAIKAGSSYYYTMGEGQNEALASLINRSRMDLRCAAEFIKLKHTWFKAIKFEDLASKPIESMKTLAEFCCISFTADLLTPTILGADFSGNNHDGKLFDGVSSANVSRWKERISDHEASIIEFWMRDVMLEWNYMPEFNSHTIVESFSHFYEWYNQKYFYYDSFSV
ncbi:sulfotransferase [bacterium]|nr:sulfotransferase [bacterium]